MSDATDKILLGFLHDYVIVGKLLQYSKGDKKCL